MNGMPDEKCVGCKHKSGTITYHALQAHEKIQGAAQLISYKVYTCPFVSDSLKTPMLGVISDCSFFEEVGTPTH